MLKLEACLSQVSPSGAWVLWGGMLPSGSLKYLTFDKHLKNNLTKPPVGYVEISEGSSALALDALSREHGVKSAVVTTAAGADRLKEQGFRGEIHVRGSLSECEILCLEFEARGWHWPRQFVNRDMIASVQEWATALLPELRRIPSIKRIAVGLGTGATAIGLNRALSPFGFEVTVFQPPRGTHFTGLRNFEEISVGPEDLFLSAPDALRLVTLKASHGPDYLEVLLNDEHLDRPEEWLVIGHKAIPAAAADQKGPQPSV